MRTLAILLLCSVLCLAASACVDEVPVADEFDHIIELNLELRNAHEVPDVPNDGIVVVAAEPVPSPILVHVGSEDVAIGYPVTLIRQGEVESALDPLGAGSGEIRIIAAAPWRMPDCQGDDCTPNLGFRVGPPLQVEAQPEHLRLSRDQGSGCQQIPVQDVRLSPWSFDRDDEIVRAVVAHNNMCATSITFTPNETANLSASGTCWSTEYAYSFNPEFTPVDVSNRYESSGDCKWLDRSEWSTALFSNVDLPAHCDVESRLSVTADAATFNEAQRLHAVSYDQEGRCYWYVVVAADPNESEPRVFEESETCTVNATRSGMSQRGNCHGLTRWMGWGTGGVESEADVRAAINRVRPFQPQDGPLEGEQLIQTCKQLSPITITVTAESFKEDGNLHEISTLEGGACTMIVVVVPDPDHDLPLDRDERCLIEARFQVTGFPYILPTVRAGQCDNVVAIALWLSSPWAASEFADGFADYVETIVESLTTASGDEWQDLRDSTVCINHTCFYLPFELEEL